MWVFHLFSHIWLSGSLLLPFMLLLLWVGSKWKRLHHLTRKRKRWVSTWGYFAFAEQLALAGFSLVRYFPDYVPVYLPYWAGGSISSALYRLHIHDVSLSIVFLLVFSLGAIGEVAMMCGLAALAWWVYGCLPRRVGALASVLDVHRYGIALILSACGFGIANHLYSTMRPVICDDCILEHGFPLHYYYEGGFGGGEGIIWRGLLGDTFLLILLAAILGWAWSSVSRRHSLRRGTL